MIRWLFVLGMLITPAMAHDEFSHAGMDPEQRDWFGEQKIPPGHPSAGNSCCSQADGQFAEERIRDGHYWVKFPASNGRWLQVPDNVVLTVPNIHMMPAVWYGGEDNTLYIRCFAPGPKM